MAIFLLKNKSEDSEVGRVDPYEQEIRDVQFVPVMDYHSINLEDLNTSLANIKEYDGIVVTSQRAVDAMKLILEGLPQDVLHKPIYTVGPTTANRLETLNFTNVSGADSGNGIALAYKMVDSLPPNSRLLFLAGEIHRRQLPDRLVEAGHSVTTKIVYKTTPNADVGQFIDQNVSSGDWIVFFSPSHTNEVLQTLKSQPDINLAAIGPTTEEFLINSGFIVSATAAEPTAQSLKIAIDNAIKTL